MHLAKKFEVKDGTFSRVPQSVVDGVVGWHIRSVLAVLPPLVGLLGVTSSRAVVVAALELWKELADEDGGFSREVFVHAPDVVFYRLVRLLWVPRLGPDSLEYVNPTMNMVTRVSALKLMGGYDSAVDYELRDRSLELIVKLAALSSDMKRRLGQRMSLVRSDCFGDDEALVDELPLEGVSGSGSDSSTTVPNARFYDAILPALTTKVGRDHTPQLAAKLLADMATVPENRAGMLYIQRKVLLVVASCDSYVAHILMKGVLHLP